MKRWIIAVAVAWGLIAVGLAYYSFRTDRPTAREQTTIADALPTVDSALADVSAALDPATSVAVLGGYQRVGRSCGVTQAREGSQYQRALVAYTGEGSEPRLLDRVAARLPSRYKATARHSGQTHTLSGDAGDFVALRGEAWGPGRVRFTADTGCRPQDAPVIEATPPTDTANRAPVQAVLDTLHLSAQTWRAHRVSCPSGGSLLTVEAEAAASPGSVADALSVGAPSGSAIIARPELYVFRNGPAGIVVTRNEAGPLTVAATIGCDG